MSKPNEVKPMNPVPDTYVPTGIHYSVKNNDSWTKLAQPLGIDAWDLIEHNFPGMKQQKQINLERATRQVNWYLREYVGCETSKDGENWTFTSGLTKGKGRWKGGHIFLPPPNPVPVPPPPSCATIQIPPLAGLPSTIRMVLQAAKVRWPSQARCLDPTTELVVAKQVYASSLVYDDIYVSDGIGMDNRPVTTAIPSGPRWIVLLNLGPTAFTSQAPQATLIHELAHAWQSQHHPQEPWRYMWNCTKSQMAAGAATALAAINSNRTSRLVQSLGGSAPPDLKLGPADAYSYVPGKPFGDYGGEQIAQQVEDFYSPPATLNPGAHGYISRIAMHMKSPSPGSPDPENIRSLSTIRFAHKSFPGVVWHE